jgi:hypothetical protein
MEHTNMLPISASRRKFINGGIVLAGTLPAYSSLAFMKSSHSNKGLLLLSPESAHLANTSLMSGMKQEDMLILDGDLVRLWRNRLEQPLLTGNRSLYGLTSWDDFLILQAQAQESSLLIGHDRHRSKLQISHQSLRIPDMARRSGTEVLLDWSIRLA